MLIEFFNTVKKSGVNVSLKELLDLIKALDSNLINSIFKKKNIDLRKYCVIFPDNKELVNEKEL